MAPEEVKQLRSRLGLTQWTFCKYLNVTSRTYSRWETGGCQHRAGHRNVLNNFVRVAELLPATCAGSAFEAWLQRPLRAFNGLRPMDILLCPGEAADKLVKYLRKTQGQ